MSGISGAYDSFERLTTRMDQVMDTFKVFIFTAALASLAAAGPIPTAAEPNAVENVRAAFLLCIQLTIDISLLDD